MWSKYLGQMKKNHLVFFCSVEIHQVLHTLLFVDSFLQNVIFDPLTSNVTEIDGLAGSGNK